MRAAGGRSRVLAVDDQDPEARDAGSPQAVAAGPASTRVLALNTIGGELAARGRAARRRSIGTFDLAPTCCGRSAPAG